MQGNASGIDAAWQRKLRALARRKTTLVRRGAAVEIVVAGKPRPAHLQCWTLSDVVVAFARHWLVSEEDGSYRLSKRAVMLIRAAQSRTPDARGPATTPAPSAAPASPLAPLSNPKESPLAWLRQRKDKAGRPLISATEYDAGERLRADFWFAQMTPRTTAAWDAASPGLSDRRSAPGAGIELVDRVVDARRRVSSALAAVGPELAGVLIDVCCHLKGLELSERASGWPKRSGKIILQIALKALARHYGLESEARPSTGRIRHWGSAGYRPRLDGETQT